MVRILACHVRNMSSNLILRSRIVLSFQAWRCGEKMAHAPLMERVFDRVYLAETCRFESFQRHQVMHVERLYRVVSDGDSTSPRSTKAIKNQGSNPCQCTQWNILSCLDGPVLVSTGNYDAMLSHAGLSKPYAAQNLNAKHLQVRYASA